MSGDEVLGEYRTIDVDGDQDGKKGNKWRKQVDKCSEKVLDEDFQFVCFFITAGVALTLALVVLPLGAIAGFYRGWAFYKSHGMEVHIGWMGGCTIGLDHIELEGRDGDSTVVWKPCEEDSHQCETCSMQEYNQLFPNTALGLYSEILAGLFAAAFVFPIFFCVVIPRCCNCCCVTCFQRSGKCDGVLWGHRIGMVSVSTMLAIWIALGTSIIVVSVVSTFHAQHLIANTTRSAVNVFCGDGNLMCSDIKDIGHCGEACWTVNGRIECSGTREECYIEPTTVGCDFPGAICRVTHSWSFYCAVIAGTFQIFCGIILMRVIWKMYQKD